MVEEAEARIQAARADVIRRPVQVLLKGRAMGEPWEIADVASFMASDKS